jgi:plasmid replication initiation protein
MISFPRLESLNNMTKMATIVAMVDKQRVLCRISYESLTAKFGASDEKFIESVAQNRSEIQDAARNLIEREHYEDDGSVLIQTRDLK